MNQSPFARATACAIVLISCGQLMAQQTNAPGDLPLDALLNTPIKTAAKYEQTLSNVAASVTVITGEEIERYGWTSLPEVLQSIPGFYVTYDRSYIYIGVRGVSRPADYNSRILVLQNGIVLNGDGTAPLPELDGGNIERIEVVRGPGSAVYGSHAMLAVVNIITKSADAIDGVGGTAMYGSLGNEGGALRMGKVLSDGLRLTASGNWKRSRGADLYFPEFNSPLTNGGVAKKLDNEERHNFQFQLEKGKFRLTAYSSARTKGAPTAWYGTDFNVESNVKDNTKLLNAEYEASLGAGKTLELSGRYEHSTYRGFYSYSTIGGVDESLAVRLSTEARYNWDVRPNQRVTVGTEVSRSSRATYDYVVGDYQLHLSQPYTQSSLYLQDEYHPSSKLGIVVGARYDSNPTSRASTSPRAAILYTPSRSTTIKLLYGTAFRTPTLYESEYADPLTPWKQNPDLKPETIRTTELVLEQRVSREIFFVGSLFRVGASEVISSQVDPADSIGWYRNIGSLKSDGAEMNLELRQESGLWAHLGFSTQSATDGGDPISNSPRAMIKAGVSNSNRSSWHGGLEAIYDSSRLTRDGDTTASFLLLNGTLSRNLGAGLRVGVSVRNLLNTRYSTPVGPEMLPQSIAQDGRTVALKLTYSR